MATNVYAKSNYDRLCIDKDLAFRKSDNKKKIELRATFVAIADYSGSRN